MNSEVPKLFALPSFQMSLKIPPVMLASVAEQPPVKILVTIRVAKFGASACGMVKTMSVAYSIYGSVQPGPECSTTSYSPYSSTSHQNAP